MKNLITVIAIITLLAACSKKNEPGSEYQGLWTGKKWEPITPNMTDSIYFNLKAGKTLNGDINVPRTGTGNGVAVQGNWAISTNDSLIITAISGQGTVIFRGKFNGKKDTLSGFVPGMNIQNFYITRKK